MSASLNVTEQLRKSKKIQKLFESGIIDHLGRSSKLTFELHVHTPTLESDCMSPVTASEHVLEAPDAVYYQRLFLAVLFFFTIALLFRLTELKVHV